MSVGFSWMNQQPIFMANSLPTPTNNTTEQKVKNINIDGFMLRQLVDLIYILLLDVVVADSGSISDH